MQIAVIGSGISGLACAHYLSAHHRVEVFEANRQIGGHTATVDVQLGTRRYAVDTGFIVFNDWTYPNFIALLDELGVSSRPTSMGFSVHDEVTGLEYCGSGLNGLFAQRRNLLSPRFLGMVRDILRFNREAVEDLDAGRVDDATTLGEYLDQRRYGQAFRRQYLVAMASAIWSADCDSVLDFPLQFFLRFFRNHGLLSVNDRPQWRVIKGGSRSYIPALSKPFADNIRLDCPVQRIRRDETGVTVLSRQGEERFDRIVLACHSDQALKLLEQPSPEEQAILGDIRYADNDVVLHTDTRLLPSRRLAWASWNYRLGGDPEQPAALTYNMNILQGLDASRTFCVSLNQTDQIDPAQILGRFTYAHPQFSVAASAAQQQWQTLLGKQHTFFCGAWWANGFHEDGVVSALRVASHFGEVL